MATNTPNNPPINQVATTAALNKDFTIKCPTFTPEKPELFFKLFRSLLRTQGVTDKIRQFNLVFLQLPARVQEKCENLLENPDDESLDKLEEETLSIYGATGEKKLQKLLTLCAAGDRTCAELLAQIRALQGPNADENSVLVKHQFFSGLPPAVQNYCKFFRGKNSLDELAVMADDFLKHQSSETAEVNAINSEDSYQTEVLTSVLNSVNMLENKLNNLEAKLLSEPTDSLSPNNIAAIRNGNSTEDAKRAAQNSEPSFSHTFPQMPATRHWNTQSHPRPQQNYPQRPQNYNNYPHHTSSFRSPASFHARDPGAARRSRTPLNAAGRPKQQTPWRQHSHMPSQHQQPAPVGQCYYHATFGHRARKCASPCNYSGPFNGPKNH